MAEVSKIAETFGKQLAQRMFAGRKGHGKAPVSYLQLTEADLANIAASAFEMGVDFAKRGAQAGQAPQEQTRG